MSVVASESSYDQALSLFASLSFSEKLSFVAEATAALKKEGKSGSVGKAAKKDKKVKDEDAPKRTMSNGAKAWVAFVKDCKEKMPERFEGLARPDAKMTVCKAIKEEDPAAYEAFKDKFIADSKGVVVEAKTEPPALSKAEKIAKFNEQAKKKAPATSAAASPTAASPPAVTPPKKGAKAEKPEAPAAPKKVVKAKKEAEKPKKKEAKEESEELPMPVKEIDGERYFTDIETNGLWKIENEKEMGAWVGFYQPGNEDEPIRYTDSMDE